MVSGRTPLLLAERLPNLPWAKLGPMLYVREGPALIRRAHATRSTRFSRPQVARHSQHCCRGGDAARDLGVSMATVHCFGGRAMPGAAARERQGSDLAIVGVTVLYLA